MNQKDRNKITKSDMPKKILGSRLKSNLLVLQAICFSLIFMSFAHPKYDQTIAKDKKIKPGKKQATLILSDGRTIQLNASKDTIVNSTNARVQIVIDSSGINYIAKDSTKKKTQKLDKKK